MASLNQIDLDKFRNIGSIKIGKEKSADIIENIDTKVQYLKLHMPTFKQYDLFFKNPLFMKIVGINHENDNETNVILEYYPNRSLNDFFEQNETSRIRTFTQTQKYIILFGIASIIQHIHINNLYHGDLDFNSIFLDDDFCPHICYIPNLSKEQTDNLSFVDLSNREILDMILFCLIAYEIMTGRKCIDDDDETGMIFNQNFDLSVIEEEWERVFFKKCWPGYDFSLTIHNIVSEIQMHKKDFGNLDEEQITKFYNKIESYQKDYSEAIKNYVNSNDIKSLSLYGKMLQHGYCVSVDKKQASQYFKQGSIQGDVDAKYMYGLMLKNGEGINKNVEKASIYLKEASDQNHQGAMFEYGTILAELNQKEGFTLIMEAAKKTYLKAMKKLQVISSAFKLPVDVGFLKFLSLSGDPFALTQSGTLIIEKNPNFGIKLLKIAISLDYPLAMYIYGKILFEGENKDEGIRYLKMAADRKFTDSCFYYGKLLLEGNHIEQDLKEASRLIKEAADNGNEEATNYYGLMLKNGRAVEKNIPEAAKYYRLAIAGGNKAAMFNYGILILTEKEIEGDANDGLFYITKSAQLGFEIANIFLKAASLLIPDNDNTKIIENIKKMAEEGDPKSMYNYAIILSNGEEDQENKQKIAQLYQEAAEKGHVGSMNNYAFMLKNGDGIQQNKPEAAKYFRMAADHGHIISMYQLAIMLIEGDGIPKNTNEGLIFLKNAADEGYEEAEFYMYEKIKQEVPSEEEEEIFESESFILMRDAENGNIEAMFKFGIKLLLGQGIYRSRPDAAEYFRKAAELGHVGAMNRYGEMLRKGDGIPKDAEKAAQLLKQAADKGHIIAMFNYAVMLSEGDGITKDKLESAKYFKEAADQFHIQSANYYGAMLYNGDEIPQNQEVSLKYLQRAAEGYNLLNKYNYGFAKMKLKSEKDNSEPISFIKKSADEGLTMARQTYADYLYEGISVPINKKEASRYYKLAADDGDIKSIYKYAEMAEKGDGIDMNVEEAMKYYQKALLTNDKEATLKIRRLNKFFSYAT